MKMDAHGCTVQIDESLFQYKRKYNRDRLKCGPSAIKRINNTNDENQIVHKYKNYENRIVGP